MGQNERSVKVKAEVQEHVESEAQERPNNKHETEAAPGRR